MYLGGWYVRALCTCQHVRAYDASGIALKYKNSLGWLQEMPDSTSLSELHAVLTSPAYSNLSRAEIRYAGVHRANWRSQEAEDGANACVRALMEPWYKRNVLILTPIDLYDRWS